MRGRSLAIIAAVLLFYSFLAIAWVPGRSPAAASTIATQQTAVIEGTVVDPKGATLAGASVSLKGPTGETIAETTSDKDGHFAFNGLVPGRYQIEVEAEGFTQAEATAVDVSHGGSKTVRIALAIAAVKETASVSAVNPVYSALRGVYHLHNADTEIADVENLVLKRDVATITFKSGHLYFLPMIEGTVTGVVFLGEGQLQINTPIQYEQRQISILTSSPSYTDNFSKLVVRFTDSTYDEIKKQANVKPGAMSPEAQSALNENESMLRHSRFFRYNLDARVLQDLLWQGHPPGLFQAFYNGKKYGETYFGIDPLGEPFVQPEELLLAVFSETNGGLWNAEHLLPHYRTSAVFEEDHSVIDMQHYDIDATVNKGKRMDAKVKATFTALYDGMRTIPFNLYGKLRVSKVTDDHGTDIKFIQENKLEDPDFYIVLPEGTQRGTDYTLTFEYGGDGAIIDLGGGNYSLVERENWYPNNAGNPLGDRATFDMTLRVNKGLMMVATGTPEGESEEGGYSVTKWKSPGPIDVAGFNYGAFKKTKVRDDKTNSDVESYANREIPDYLKDVQRRAEAMDEAGEQTDTTLGSLNTVSMMDKARAEGQLSLEIYTDLFGPLPYGRVAMSQQPFFGFGQSWPMLVYMPLLAYLDSTYRHQLGMDRALSFVKIVGPHEVSHQWWGHIIGWKSYRDQWMSEGFADFSASMFAQIVYKDDTFLKFWKEQRDLLTEKTFQGRRPTDVGGVYMGYRLDTAKTEGVTRRMIYPKGAFILHMIRMLMWDPKTGDQRFSEMMKDFVKTYYNQNVSTQDFQRIVEKHMTRDMDLDGNGKMDWFFNEWVYTGTEIPDYKLEYRLDPADKGVKLVMKVTQSNVDDKFKMRVPIYLDIDGKIHRLGSVGITGNSTTDELAVNLPSKPKRVMLCHYEDVLCTTDSR
ncbi:MAG TPA: carboxypeptidase regulatory-like domain-containing protein [Blastocatellia bacterium]